MMPSNGILGRPSRKAAVIALLVLVGVIVLGFIWRSPSRTLGTTVTIGTSDGFVSISTSESGTTPVPRDRYERLLARYLKGDLFDNLWIAHKPGDEGFTITHKGADTELDVSFLTREVPRIAAFRKTMKALGHVGTENRWNVGMGPDMESLTISYLVPTDGELGALLDRVLVAVDGPSKGTVYVYPWRTDPKAGASFSVQANVDYLAQIP